MQRNGSQLSRTNCRRRSRKIEIVSLVVNAGVPQPFWILMGNARSTAHGIGVAAVGARGLEEATIFGNRQQLAVWQSFTCFGNINRFEKDSCALESRVTPPTADRE